MSGTAMGRTIGLVGRKCGMTRIFTPEGVSIPVTVLEILPNRITQIKSQSTDGYSAIQVTMGERKASRVNKALSGHFSKANSVPGEGLWEFRLENEAETAFSIGSELTVELFKEGELVDVQGTTKGRGFTGTITRWNFRSQRASHGVSVSHNLPGSIGQNQTPGRVFKGKKMAGHWGVEKKSVQNLEVIRVDAVRNVLLVKGAIPGAANGKIIVRSAVKGNAKSNTASVA